MKKLFFSSMTLLSLFSFSSCKKSGDSAGSNNLSVFNVSQVRSIGNSMYRFEVYLDQPASAEVTVSYATEAGTAIAGKDFKAATGTLTIPANSNKGAIDIEVIGDSTRKDNQFFYLNLSNAKNATIKTGKGTATIININGTYFPVDNAGYSTPATYPGYTLVWADEFNGNSVDAANWTFEQGAGGWGNNELQNYTSRPENAFVSAGNLIIEARAESYGGSNYTSARMITKNKKVFKFGRIDMRAKLPKGRGIWPALWMLGNNIDAVNWPACGEIDIMEYLGHETNKVYGTMHWATSGNGHNSKGSSRILATGGYDQEFHVYSLIWQQDTLKVLVDDQQYLQVVKSDVNGNYPFNADFFFIFNIAVGGNWPGSPDANTVFPQRMAVDYVRVFQ